MCAHCGSNEVKEEYDDHMCMKFLFDWLEAIDGQHRARDYGELMSLMYELGIV